MIRQLLYFLTGVFVTAFLFGFTLPDAAPDSLDRQDAELAEQDTLYVEEFLLCQDVVEREPIDIVQSFEMQDERAWGFAVIHSTYQMHTVTFRWYYEDERYFTFDSSVGRSPNWRTYSSVGLQPGAWRVELFNEYDEKLDEIRFHVSE